MKKAIFIGVPFILLLVLVGWRYMQKTETNKQLGVRAQGLKNGPANVVLAKVGPLPVTLTFEAVGTVSSPYTVELCPKLTGKIVSLPDYLREGYTVKKGQVLGQIDPTETIGQVLQAQSLKAQAVSTLVSAQYTQHPTVENVNSQIAQAKATVDSNIADYDQVKENLDAQVHQATANVTDTQAKVDAAKAATANAVAGLASANATLEDAQAKLDRQMVLYKQNFIAAQDVDDSKAAQKVAKANVDVAQGLVNSAKQNEVSLEQQKREADDNLSIVKKTGETNIRAAKAKVVLARAALGYAEATNNLKPAYAAQIKADEAAVAAAQGNINQANARLSDCNLVATIDGTISKRNADVGTVVNAGASILEVQYLKWLYVTSTVPIEYSDRVVKGTTVTMTFDAIPGLKLNGTVAELSNVADPQNRQYDAMIKIDNTDGKFRPGMYARVHYLVSKKIFPIAVAREAIKTSNVTGISTATMVDTGNVAHVVTVVTGEQDTNNIEIKSGLDAGDRVVVLSYVPVKDKQKVVEGGIKKKPKNMGTNPNLPADQTAEGAKTRPGTGQSSSSSGVTSGAGN